MYVENILESKDFAREMILKTSAVPSVKLAKNQVKDACKNIPVSQSKNDSQIADVLPIKTFICSICGSQFDQKFFLINHCKFCKNIDNPAERFGVGNVTVKEEPPDVEIQTKDDLGNDSPFDLMFDIKEEVEFSETTIFPEVTPIQPLPERPIENLTTDMEDELFRFDIKEEVEFSETTIFPEVTTDMRNTRRTMGIIHQNISIKEETEASVESPTVHHFVCNLCASRFSNELHLEDHYNVCTDIKNPTDRVGINASVVKKELCEGEVWMMYVPDTNMKQEPISDMNIDLNLDWSTTCDFSTSQSGILKKDTTTHTGEKLLKCTVSDYSTAGSFKKHIKKHAGEKPFKCTLCEYSTAHSGCLKIHMRNHTGEKPFKCTICEYSTADSGSLKNHMRKHTGEKPFKCKICEYSASQTGQLKIHMRNHTGEKPFKCTVCEFSTAYPQCLKLHMTSHTGIKPFKCTICEYSAAKSGRLKQHLGRHAKIKPFKCTVCEYSSTHTGDLKIHMRKHTGEKPFKCKICEYSSARSGHLRSHLRKHTGEKPFKCTTCEHSTAHSGRFKIHMRKHTGEKPFKCTICEYSAAESRRLKAHMRKHTEEKPFQCDIQEYS